MNQRAKVIVAVVLLAIALPYGRTQADDYVEDVYFWQDDGVRDEQGTLVPQYNTRVREIQFIEDTTLTTSPDTVRLIRHEVMPSERL
ncbi:MAG: hypothetical protein IJQ97_03975 [Paludibacteraceae bacterium]|nr:hypothetical protein [Paludibacteraceae bacterium]